MSLSGDLPRATRIRANVQRLGAWQLLCALCAEYRVDTVEVLSERRFQRWADCRHRFWLILYDTLGLSHHELARVFCCDHTTICNGLKKARKLLEKEHAA